MVSAKRFTIACISMIFILIIMNVIVVGHFSDYKNINPYRLSLMDVKAFIDGEENPVSLYDKDTQISKDIISSMYGPYAYFILNNAVQISVPRSGEFNLPQIMYNNNHYILRESPTLRYDLWEYSPPSIMLLGSSMFFQNFNRTEFFKRLPETKLIDFCIGDNTPEVTLFMMQKILDCGLKIEPGTTVIYGLNTYELKAGYSGQNSDHVIAALGDVDDKSVQKRLRNWLRITLKTQGPKFIIDRMLFKFKRRNFDYMAKISPSLADNPEELAKWLSHITATRTFSGTQFPFDPKKVIQLIQLIRFVKQSNSTFILILLPSSTIDLTYYKSVIESLDQTLKEISNVNQIDYYNLWDHAKIGINDTHFVYRGYKDIKVNPQHLNYEGSIIFTDYIIQNILMKQISALQKTP